MPARMNGVMNDAKVVLPIFACCLLAWAQAPSGEPVSTQDEPEAVFRSDTRLVEVHATVTDSTGRLLPDLPRSAFKIA